MGEESIAQMLKAMAALGGAGWIVAALFGFMYLQKDKQNQRLLRQVMRASISQNADNVRLEKAQATLRKATERKRGEAAAEEPPL